MNKFECDGASELIDVHFRHRLRFVTDPAILCLPPAGLEHILWRNPAYDARPLLQGVPAILGELVRQVICRSDGIKGLLLADRSVCRSGSGFTPHTSTIHIWGASLTLVFLPETCPDSCADLH